jgi:hypothetical protein
VWHGDHLRTSERAGHRALQDGRRRRGHADFSRGKAVYVGACPGLSYLKGARFVPAELTLPFKVRKSSIVVFKGPSALQCTNCPQYLLEDAVLARVDGILGPVDGGVELEIIRYAA